MYTHPLIFSSCQTRDDLMLKFLIPTWILALTISKSHYLPGYTVCPILSRFASLFFSLFFSILFWKLFFLSLFLKSLLLQYPLGLLLSHPVLFLRSFTYYHPQLGMSSSSLCPQFHTCLHWISPLSFSQLHWLLKLNAFSKTENLIPLNTLP